MIGLDHVRPFIRRLTAARHAVDDLTARLAAAKLELTAARDELDTILAPLGEG